MKGKNKENQWGGWGEKRRNNNKKKRSKIEHINILIFWMYKFLLSQKKGFPNKEKSMNKYQWEINIRVVVKSLMRIL